MDGTELTFPLVPRWRPVGSVFGRLRAARRGIGSSVASTREYRPGDDLGLIDWKLSARLSSIRGTPEFVVREDFADEAPRAVVVADQAPSMSLYPDDFPWLSKPQALRSIWGVVSSTSVRELGLAVTFTDLNFPSIGSKFDANGLLLDVAYEKRVSGFLDELVWMSTTLRWGRRNVASKYHQM